MAARAPRAEAPLVIPPMAHVQASPASASGQLPQAGAKQKSYEAVWYGRDITRPSGAVPGPWAENGTIRLSRTPNTASLSR